MSQSNSSYKKIIFMLLNIKKRKNKLIIHNEKYLSSLQMFYLRAISQVIKYISLNIRDFDKKLLNKMQYLCKFLKFITIFIKL